MRRLFYVLTFVMVTGLVYDACAQMRRNSIKRNNRRMMTYRGNKFGFGKERRYNMVNVTLNALNYYGDLAPKPSNFSTDLKLTRPAIGLGLTHRFGPRYSLQVSFTYGAIKGSDAESADADDTNNAVFRNRRNLSFRNRIQELSIIGVFDLFQNQSTYISRPIWTPYAYLGVAVFHHNPQAQVPATDLNGNPFPNAGKWVALQPLGTEGQNLDLPADSPNHGNKPYKRIQVSIPIGFGARFRLNELLDLSVEFGFRYLFTDYLDDVSKDYVFVGAFGNNELAKALSYRTNESKEVKENPGLLIPISDPRYPDAGSYNLLPGYGHENPGLASDSGNERGNPGEKDIYTVTTIRLSYIIGKNFHRAKFR